MLQKNKLSKNKRRKDACFFDFLARQCVLERTLYFIKGFYKAPKMKAHRPGFLKIAKDVWEQFLEDNPMLYAASIAFYTIFSLPATLLIIVAVAGNFFAQEAVTGELYEQIRDFVGSKSALEIQRILENANQSSSSVIATIVGVGTLMFSATTVFVSIQNALNAIWKVKPQPQRGYVKFILDRLLSFALVITLGFLMMVSLLLDTILALFRDLLTAVFSGVTYYVMEAINFSISFLVISFIFAMILKFLPDAKTKWSDVRLGAVVTTILFIIGKFLIRLYLNNSSFESTYGAAGSFVVILVWVYYSAVILLLGAEFTLAYAKYKGRSILPSKNAVKIEFMEVDVNKGIT